MAIGAGLYVARSSVNTGQAPQITLSDEEKVLKFVGPMTEDTRTRFLEYFSISGISADNGAAVLDFYRNYRKHPTPGESISEAQRIFLNAKGMDDKTLLARAILLDKLDLIPDLLACGAEVTKPCTGINAGSLTPLFLAAQSNRPACIPLLIKAGADVDENDEGTGDTPLNRAVKMGNEAACEALITAGANINARNKKSDCPLYYAIDHGMLATVKLLISRGASWTGNCSAALLQQKDLLIFLCESYPALPNVVFSDAARVGADPDLLTLLVKMGANVNLTDFWGYTALKWAVMGNHQPQVVRLLELGADINKTADNGETALALALRNRDRQMAILLIENGAVVRPRDFADHDRTFPQAPDSTS
jgi:ankyrin repeat protein